MPFCVLLILVVSCTSLNNAFFLYFCTYVLVINSTTTAKHIFSVTVFNCRDKNYCNWKYNLFSVSKHSMLRSHKFTWHHLKNRLSAQNASLLLFKQTIIKTLKHFFPFPSHNLLYCVLKLPEWFSNFLSSPPTNCRDVKGNHLLLFNWKDIQKPDWKKFLFVQLKSSPISNKN